MEKISFRLSVVDDYPPVSTERVWAQKLTSGLFRIRNIPFYIMEVSLDDEVAVEVGTEGEYLFAEVKKESGNSTVRIIFFEAGVSEISAVLAAIVEMGGTWEGMSKRFFAVNVPEGVSLDNMLEFLDVCTEKEWLDYEFGMIRQ
ncbi:DUF4265 domain-containing protein [Pseudomonas purpurea]|uniref:DUF4265 domain-containing protein n=1 Tax=Pseudomonas purpurea TaxID=3136737 RepID=UPI003264DDDB